MLPKWLFDFSFYKCNGCHFVFVGAWLKNGLLRRDKRIRVTRCLTGADCAYVNLLCRT